MSIKLETANPVRSFKARGTEVVASLPPKIDSMPFSLIQRQSVVARS